MDYLFVIELNDQLTELDALKRKIYSHGKEIPYLEIDEQKKGLVGIVKFAEDKTNEQQAAFFDKLREYVAEINGLPTSGTLTAEHLSLITSASAKWARASMGNVLVGFEPKDTPDPNSDENIYQVVSTLKGGIGGKR